MVSLKNYTHDKKKVKEKYEFFANSIENTTDVIGKTPHHPIENHLSLIEKIHFQIEHNQERYQSKYIKNYLSNSLFSSNDTYLSTGLANPIKKILEHKRDYIKLKELVDIKIDNLRKSVLKHYILQVYELIANDAVGSKASRNKLEYYSNLIVSEFLFEGFTRKDIQHIPNLIITGKTERDNRAECFIKKKKWRRAKVKTQLLRIHDLCYSEKLNLHFTYGIKNLICKNDYKYRYENVKIVSSKSTNLTKHIPSKYRNEFLKNNEAFAFQNIKTNSVFTGLDKFTANVQTTLNYINTTYNGHAYIDLGSFHIYNIDKKQGQKTWKNLNTSLTERKSEIKKDLTDIEATLSSIKKTKRVQKLIKLDKLFYKARREPDLEEKTVYYWRYLESLFNYHDDDSKETSEKSDFIIKRVSRILISEEEQNYFNVVTVGLLNTTINISNRMNLTSYEAHRKFLINNRTFNFEKFKDFPFAQKHIFLGREIKKITTYKKSKELTLAYKYYVSTLRESYELRNFSVHSGKSFEKTVIKAGLTLEIVVKRIRRIIIESLQKEEFKRIKMKSIIEKLSVEGMSKLNNQNGG